MIFYDSPLVRMESWFFPKHFRTPRMARKKRTLSKCLKRIRQGLATKKVMASCHLTIVSIKRDVQLLYDSNNFCNKNWPLYYDFKGCFVSGSRRKRSWQKVSIWYHIHTFLQWRMLWLFRLIDMCGPDAKSSVFIKHKCINSAEQEKQNRACVWILYL